MVTIRWYGMDLWSYGAEKQIHFDKACQICANISLSKQFTLVMQELTNKLQRYLNQRFMLDSDQVKYDGGGDVDGRGGDGDGDDDGGGGDGGDVVAGVVMVVMVMMVMTRMMMSMSR